MNGEHLANLMYDLPVLVAAKRTRTGLTLRGAAEQVGVEHHTILRIERGYDCRVSTLIRVLTWLDTE